jgi:hypothetical protein
MTEAPETIRASLTAVRDGWYQLVNLRGGQRAFPLTEYTRSDIAEAEVARLREALGEFARFASKDGLGASVPFGQSKLHKARAALANGETDQ